MTSAQPTLTFGTFRLDSGSGQLFHEGAPVPLTPKAFALLHYMAARAGQLIPKRNCSTMWPDVFVGDAVLKTTIRICARRCTTISHTTALHRDRTPPRLPLHRAGYAHRPRQRARLWPATTPRVHYAHSGSVNIAYQVIGSGRSIWSSSWLGVAPRILLERAALRALPRATGIDGAADPSSTSAGPVCRIRCRSASSPSNSG